MVHPNGVAGEHGVVVVPRASGVLALDGADVVFARQARYAVDRVVIEVVKGGAAAAEDERAAAERELREELGFVAARWSALGLIYEVPSIIQVPIYLFLARDLRTVATDLEDVETIDAVRMPFRTAYLAAARGEINDAVTVAALMRTAQLLEDEQTGYTAS